jgi:hypothetical protein
MFAQKAKPGMDLDDARALLPKVGEILYREPTILGYASSDERDLRRCVVTYVNREKLWYEVQFLSSGFRQGFKAIEPDD